MLQNLNLINYFEVDMDVLTSCNVVLEYTILLCHSVLVQMKPTALLITAKYYYLVSVLLVIRTRNSRLNSSIIPDSYVNNL